MKEYVLHNDVSDLELTVKPGLLYCSIVPIGKG